VPDLSRDYVWEQPLLPHPVTNITAPQNEHPKQLFCINNCPTQKTINGENILVKEQKNPQENEA
jgi:hypothetical protein